MLSLLLFICISVMETVADVSDNIGTVCVIAVYVIVS